LTKSRNSVYTFIESFSLNERQQKAIGVFREERRVTNTQYQEITGTSRATAKRDLEDLVNKGLLKLVGAGHGAFYYVPKKRLINGSNGSSESEKENGS
jgi:ATP-dependent DNA helicase RecG